MKEDKMSFWEMIRYNRRGIKLIHHLTSWNHFWNIMMAITGLLFCYWNYYWLSKLLDHIVAQASKEALLQDVVLMVAGQIVIHIANRYVIYYYYYSGSNVWEFANAYLNRKIMDMDYEYMESESIHNLRREIDIMARHKGGGINQLYWCLPPLVESTGHLIVALGYTIYLVYKGHSAFQEKTGEYMLFFAVFIAMLVILLVLNIWNGEIAQKRTYQKNEEMLPYTRQYTFYTEEYINREECGKNIRMFHQQNLLSKHLKGLFGQIFQLIDDISDIEVTRSKYASILETLISGLTYFMLGILVLKKGITIGNVCLYAGCVSMFLGHFRYWILQLTLLADNTKYVKMYFDFLDIPNTKYEGRLPVEKRDDDRFTIEFRHVSFRYPGSDVDVLKDFSIKFHIGERLAVVGKNGSGKTTFIKLLCRLYDPTEGEILLNGIDIRKYDYEEYLSLFSVVFQDFKIPAFTIGQNVAADLEYDRDRVTTALKKVGLSELLDSLPQDLDTPLYKDFDNCGVDISGGEAQKIAIARALYHDTPFVILDEPTAALDPLAEYEIYSHFDELVGSKTAVYISHRLSSCQFCNDILVIDEGQAIQRGNHETLVKDKEGLYYTLWNTQAQYYQEA